MIRRIVLTLAVVVLAVYGWLAFQVYRSKADPESFRAWDGEHAWIIGPSGKNLTEAADLQMEQALSVLGDRSLPPRDRLAAYQEHLRRAEGLLVRSLRAQPAQAAALAKLAAVRWELDPPLTEEDTRQFLDTVEVASKMAPGVPRVQMRLGELLLKMGRQGEAAAYLRNTLELSPEHADEVVALLLDTFMDPEEIQDALPRIPETMVALFPAFEAEGLLPRFLELADPLLPEATPDLLRDYGKACLRTGGAERLLGRMSSLAFGDPERESARLRERSRAHLALGETGPAIEFAEKARDLVPEAPQMRTHLGEVLRASGRLDEAIREFRAALSLIARNRNATAKSRATIYRRIGQTEDLRNRPDLAFDAYKQAVALDLEDDYSAGRLREMRQAAGFVDEGASAQDPANP